MSTKLYFHDEANPLTSGSFPSSEQSSNSATYTASGANTLRHMDTDIGVSQAFAKVSGTVFNSGDAFYRMFCSHVLSGSQTIGGMSITVNMADKQTFQMYTRPNGLNLYIWRPSTNSKVGTIVDQTSTSLGGNYPSSLNSEQVTILGPFGGAGVSASDGDVIIAEVWSASVTCVTGAGDAYFYYDGTTENTTENAVVSNHASYIEFTEDIIFRPDASDADSAGVTTATAIGAGIAKGATACAGSCVVASTGKSTSAAVGGVTGVSPVDGKGSQLKVTVGGGATGVGTVSGVGIAGKVATASSDGVAALTGIGKSNAEVVGSADGLTTTGVVGTALTPMVGASSGSSEVLGAKGAGIGLGNSIGLAVPMAVGMSDAYAVGLSDGVASDAVEGRAAKVAVTICVGIANQDGIGRSFALSVGSAPSDASVLGIGVGASTATGTSSGLATDGYIGGALMESLCVAEGTSEVLGGGAILGLFSSVGDASSLSTESFVGASAGRGLAQSGGIATMFGDMKQIGWSRPARISSTWVQEAREI